MEIISRSSDVKTNARIRYIPDENGVYQPYEMLVFPSSTFVPDGWELAGDGKQNRAAVTIDEAAAAAEEFSSNPDENRRKSYQRARNNLFNLLMCTTAFDCFATLTLDGAKIDRYDYHAIMKDWRVWFSNRVQRNNLVYAFVPEFHKDGAIHFHGLCNFDALNTSQAFNPYTNVPLVDPDGRQIYNISDWPYGYSTVIPLSGDNARTATAKYCYKYITKSKGEKVGGRYYLSGGQLGRPKYDYVNIDYYGLDAKEIVINDYVRCKKVRL